jgi:threonine dehydratase
MGAGFLMREHAVARGTYLFEHAIAAASGVAHVLCKDERVRLGIISFKILGAGCAVAEPLQSRVAADFRTSVSIANLIAHRHDKWFVQKAITCASAGNHGRAVAALAKPFGARCKSFRPAMASDGRELFISQFGTKVFTFQGDCDPTVCSAAAAVPGDLPIHAQLGLMQQWTVILISEGVTDSESHADLVTPVRKARWRA